MDDALIKQKLTWIIVNEFGVDEDEIIDYASLVYDLGFDSLDIVEVIMCIEEEFDIYIPDEELDNVLIGDLTFNMLVDLIKESVN